MNYQINHIDENNLLWSLIDEKAIENSHINHLKECSTCQKKQSDLIGELNELGRLAHHYTPTPRRSLRPVATTRNNLQFLRVKNALVYAMMLMICIGGILGIWPTQNQQTDKIAIIEAKQQIENMFIPENDWNEKTYSILPDEFQYMVVDEFDLISVPFYDYVFPVNIPENEIDSDIDEQTKRVQNNHLNKFS